MNIDLTDPQTAWGQCLIQTQTLVERTPGALYIRITGLEYPGREHWAAFLPDPDDPEGNGKVIDLTARQFRANAPSPWEGDLYDWLDDACEWLQDGLAVELYDHFQSASGACWTHIREEIEPGPITHPWQVN